MTRRQRLGISSYVFKIALPASVACAIPYAYVMSGPSRAVGLADVLRFVPLCTTASLSAGAWAYLLAPALVSRRRATAAIIGAVLPVLSLQTWLAVSGLTYALFRSTPNRFADAFLNSVIFSVFGLYLTGWLIVPLGVAAALVLRRRYVTAGFVDTT